MADRTRPIRIEFCVTEQEKRLIQHKMEQLGTRNMGAAVRAAKGGDVTTTGFSMCGLSISGFPDGGEVAAPERTANGFQPGGFPTLHRG